MTGLLRLAWSIALSGWRASWNRSFRFSRVKSGAIFLVLQAGMILAVARRAPAMASADAGTGLAGVLALMALQMAWFGFMVGFSRGQMQLYQGILVPLFQVTPARPMGFLLGRVIEAVPSRAWSMLLWGWMYAGLLPQFPRWALAPSLALFGLVTGMAAHLSGLLLLTFWGRFWPKSMRNGMLIFGAGTLALITWAVIYLSEGGSVTELAITLRHYRIQVAGAVALIAGVPGLALLVAFFLRPDLVEDLYRRGVYNVVELNEAEVSRPARSAWLPIADGVLRAILSREWLQLLRAKVTRIQLMIWLAGMVGVYAAGQAVAGRPFGRVLTTVGPLILAVWFIAFGHWVVRAFETERVTIALYRLAAVSTPRLLLAKFVAVAAPSALLVLAGTLVGAWAAGLTPSETASLAAYTLVALGAGIGGGFGAAAATVGEADDPETASGPRRDLAPAPTGNTNAWWSLARTGALVACLALPMWTASGQPGLSGFKVPDPLLWGLVLLLPAALLSGGSWLMIRSWSSNG